MISNVGISPSEIKNVIVGVMAVADPADDLPLALIPGPVLGFDFLIVLILRPALSRSPSFRAIRASQTWVSRTRTRASRIRVSRTRTRASRIRVSRTRTRTFWTRAAGAICMFIVVRRPVSVFGVESRACIPTGAVVNAGFALYDLSR